MSLFDLLACPTCKTAVARHADHLSCETCEIDFPILDGVPVMFPDGSVPDVVHEAELHVRDSYDPWVHRTILQSLPDSSPVIEIGSGNMALDDPNIIRLDVVRTPFVDIIADAHHLPFLPGSIDYIFSLAVFEHLRNPFEAAESIRETLRPGGYVYHECNFVFSYHGYPHHYFNASAQGMAEVFADYDVLGQGVAPYQMPSFALNMILNGYLEHSQADRFVQGRPVVEAVRQLLDVGLTDYDLFFTQEAAYNVAAGTWFAGRRVDEGAETIVPAPVMDLWRADTALQERFADPNDCTRADNLLWWARTEGRRDHQSITEWYDRTTAFVKWDDDRAPDRSHIRGLPRIDPQFGVIGHGPQPASIEDRVRKLDSPMPGRRDRVLDLADAGLRSIRRNGVRESVAKAAQRASRSHRGQTPT